jgi:hypothetical protein
VHGDAGEESHLGEAQGALSLIRLGRSPVGLGSKSIDRTALLPTIRRPGQQVEGRRCWRWGSALTCPCLYDNDRLVAVNAPLD